MHTMNFSLRASAEPSLNCSAKQEVEAWALTETTETLNPDLSGPHRPVHSRFAWWRPRFGPGQRHHTWWSVRWLLDVGACGMCYDLPVLSAANHSRPVGMLFTCFTVRWRRWCQCNNWAMMVPTMKAAVYHRHLGLGRYAPLNKKRELPHPA